VSLRKGGHQLPPPSPMPREWIVVIVMEVLGYRVQVRGAGGGGQIMMTATAIIIQGQERISIRRM
jgi:hypothetical protein